MRNYDNALDLIKSGNHKDLYSNPFTIINPQDEDKLRAVDLEASVTTSQAEPSGSETTGPLSYNQTATQAGGSSSSFKRPRTGNSPILDEIINKILLE
ncbi:hypothetical protein NPX13_g7125 [Xylaria arbuscula]|uniref:Uncharacterized protein n=1 Tax=Xylaria arbuscula TaxID=114810 RepID=A0A9W8TLH3_9PEZI|nr:hypothetical protein NPX13_g7125 [Xylaria arbuscula]